VPYRLDLLQILLLVSGLNGEPRLLQWLVFHLQGGEHGLNAIGVAIGGLVSLHATSTASLCGELRALGLAVAFLAAVAAFTRERAVNCWVGALRFHVALLTTVEASAAAATTTALWLVWAIASEVAVATAAARSQSR